MTRQYIFCAAISITFGALGACSAVDSTTSVSSSDPMLPTSTTQQPGITMQGITMQGMTMQGMRLAGATLGGDPLDQVQVQRGEVEIGRAHV